MFDDTINSIGEAIGKIVDFRLQGYKKGMTFVDYLWNEITGEAHYRDEYDVSELAPTVKDLIRWGCE
jgi:hypothetical protein